MSEICTSGSHVFRPSYWRKIFIIILLFSIPVVIERLVFGSSSMTWAMSGAAIGLILFRRYEEGIEITDTEVIGPSGHLTQDGKLKLVRINRADIDRDRSLRLSSRISPFGGPYQIYAADGSCISLNGIGFSRKQIQEIRDLLGIKNDC